MPPQIDVALLLTILLGLAGVVGWAVIEFGIWIFT